MLNTVIIFGVNTLGRIAKDIFESNKILVYGFLDDNKEIHKTEVDDVLVLGSSDDEDFLKLIGTKCQVFVASDDNKFRKSIVEMLLNDRKASPINAIHSFGQFSDKIEIGCGNLFDMGFTCGSGLKVGSHNIIHANTHLGAEVQIGDYVQIGAGSIINSGVTIEDEVFIGSGAIIVSGLTVGKGARVGAGSVVIGSVKEGETVFGNPAGVVKPK